MFECCQQAGLLRRGHACCIGLNHDGVEDLGLKAELNQSATV